MLVTHSCVCDLSEMTEFFVSDVVVVYSINSCASDVYMYCQSFCFTYLRIGLSNTCSVAVKSADSCGEMASKRTLSSRELGVYGPL